jgi:oligopeptide/dipeptide ABC transporter ATP-binding protein
MSEILLKVNNLKTYLKRGNKVVRAVDGVDFEIMQGETLGLVGESGCGKTMIARSLMGIVPGKPVIFEGEIWLSNINLMGKKRFNNGRFSINIIKLANHFRIKWKHNKAVSDIRSKKIGMIFQIPESSMDPLFKVKSQIAEVTMRVQMFQSKKRSQCKKESLKEASNLLLRLGVNIEDRTYPYELSGGMLQRASIASAIAGQPELLIADEPTTALDVTIQLKVLSLLKEIKENFNLSMLLIGHDMSVISALTDKVAVMYNGKIMEYGQSEILLDENVKEKHPYTLALLKCVPRLLDDYLPLALPGNVPDSTETLPGCRFSSRCKEKENLQELGNLCDTKEPPEFYVKNNHKIRCWKFSNFEVKE